jgi:hypothetical protein
VSFADNTAPFREDHEAVLPDRFGYGEFQIIPHLTVAVGRFFVSFVWTGLPSGTVITSADATGGAAAFGRSAFFS